MVPMTDRRRADDQLVVPMFIAGCGCLAIAGGLAGALVLTKTPFTPAIVTVIVVFAVGGLLLMPTHRILLALRAWRKNGDIKPPAAG